MRRRFAFAAAALSFAILLALLIWQGSFRINYEPSTLTETILLQSISTLIFLLTLTMAFLLFRAVVKGYIDRQRNREGSRIRSKLLFGALVLTLAPTLLCVLFSGYVLNRHLDLWFSSTAIKKLDDLYRKEATERLAADTRWLSLLPETRKAAVTGQIDSAFFRKLSKEHKMFQLVLQRDGKVPLLLYQAFEKPRSALIQAGADVFDSGRRVGRLAVVATLSEEDEIAQPNFTSDLAGRKKFYQDTYFRLICLITLFVMFLAAWTAQILSRQISIPISALLGAAQQVRAGNLAYRIRVSAMDELATLVRAFNEMTNELEANARELESRRRFTEAILESIPTGVISVSANERIELVNRALSGIFSQAAISSAKYLEDLFSGDDLAEVRYMLKRARRTGAAASQIDIQRPDAVLHLAVTVAALEQQRGFVMVLEDTSDLLRAQKAVAWQEVARRIAHEIKNPLTPISLSADRIARQLKRLDPQSPALPILQECTQTIQQEVQTVKSLVDEFSQFSRFPRAKLISIDLNEVVESALAVFAGRLDGIELITDLDRTIPCVMADREQMKRVIVNLIDNAAEAMTDVPLRKLRVATRQSPAETVELTVTDTGPGITGADKEKLFLPYFSTKGRGTGLGLAIVSRIITEHHGSVRVEDNFPSGARFLVELNPTPGAEHGISEADRVHPATL